MNFLVLLGLSVVVVGLVLLQSSVDLHLNFAFANRIVLCLCLLPSPPENQSHTHTATQVLFKYTSSSLDENKEIPNQQTPNTSSTTQTSYVVLVCVFLRLMRCSWSFTVSCSPAFASKCIEFAPFYFRIGIFIIASCDKQQQQKTRLSASD